MFEQVETRRLAAFDYIGVSLVLKTSTYGLPSGIFCTRVYGRDDMCSLFATDFLYLADHTRIDVHRLTITLQATVPICSVTPFGKPCRWLLFKHS